MTMPRYSLVNSSRMQPQHEVGLLVEELRRLRSAASAEICSHWLRSRRTSRSSSSCGRALGRGAHDEPGVVGTDAVEHLAQALALVVGEALRDAVGVGLARHHHQEAPGEADLLGEAGALVRDRVLRHLHGDHLPVLEHPLDLGLVAALDVGLVEGDVAAVEHAVLRRADVDERRLHAGQHVLHPAEVDVAVDRLVAGGRGQRSARPGCGPRAPRCACARPRARARTSGSGRPGDPCGCGRGAARARRRRARRSGASPTPRSARTTSSRAVAAAGAAVAAAPAPLPAGPVPPVPLPRPPPPPAPPRPRPRPPRRRRRLGAVPARRWWASPSRRRRCRPAGRRGRASRRSAARGRRDASRRSRGRAVWPRPASSSATSATSSVVRPRSAAASV